VVPKILDDPLAWFDFLSSSSGTVSRTSLIRAVSAMLPVDADDLEEAPGECALSSVQLGQEVTPAEFLANGLYSYPTQSLCYLFMLRDPSNRLWVAISVNLLQALVHMIAYEAGSNLVPYSQISG
jgi:hypothetical protein